MYFSIPLFLACVVFCLRWSLGSRIQLDFLEIQSDNFSLGEGEYKPIYNCSNYWHISMYYYFAIMYVECFLKILFLLS